MGKNNDDTWRQTVVDASPHRRKRLDIDKFRPNIKFQQEGKGWAHGIIAEQFDDKGKDGQTR